MLISLGAFAQVFTSKSMKGFWTENSSWVGGQAPGVANLQNENITIYGFIRLDGGLSFNNNSSLTINDTLFINGNLTFNNKAKINIGNNGVLIVNGNYDTNNNIDISNGGVVIVTGEFSTNNGSEITNNGNIYLYDDDPEFGGNSNISGNEPGSEDDLMNDQPMLFDIVQSANTSMPLELMYFKDKIEENRILLRWATSFERNSDIFTIERSSDMMHWKAMGEVAGAGNSADIQNYSFADVSPISGKAYYRLKATDFDGNSEYHKVIGVDFENTVQAASVYPNPLTGNNLNISTGFDASEQGKVHILNLYGKEVYKEILQSGINSINFANSLEPGIYIVLVRQGAIEQKLKLQVN